MKLLVLVTLCVAASAAPTVENEKDANQQVVQHHVFSPSNTGYYLNPFFGTTQYQTGSDAKFVVGETFSAAPTAYTFNSGSVIFRQDGEKGEGVAIGGASSAPGATIEGGSVVQDGAVTGFNNIGAVTTYQHQGAFAVPAQFSVQHQAVSGPVVGAVQYHAAAPLVVEQQQQVGSYVTGPAVATFSAPPAVATFSAPPAVATFSATPAVATYSATPAVGTISAPVVSYSNVQGIVGAPAVQTVFGVPSVSTGTTYSAVSTGTAANTGATFVSGVAAAPSVAVSEQAVAHAAISVPHSVTYQTDKLVNIGTQHVDVPVQTTHVEIPIEQRVHYGLEKYVAGSQTSIVKPELQAPAIEAPKVFAPKVIHEAPEITLKHSEVVVEEKVPNYVHAQYDGGVVVEKAAPAVESYDVPTAVDVPQPIKVPQPYAVAVPTPVKIKSELNPVVNVDVHKVETENVVTPVEYTNHHVAAPVVHHSAAFGVQAAVQPVEYKSVANANAAIVPAAFATVPVTSGTQGAAAAHTNFGVHQFGAVPHAYGVQGVAVSPASFITQNVAAVPAGVAVQEIATPSAGFAFNVEGSQVDSSSGSVAFGHTQFGAPGFVSYEQIQGLPTATFSQGTASGGNAESGQVTTFTGPGTAGFRLGEAGGGQVVTYTGAQAAGFSGGEAGVGQVVTYTGVPTQAGVNTGFTFGNPVAYQVTGGNTVVGHQNFAQLPVHYSVGAVPAEQTKYETNINVAPAAVVPEQD